MSRLHPQQWGERQQIDVRDDWSLLTEEERRRKADELIAMIRELREPPMQPPAMVYRPEQAPDEPESGRSGWQRRSAAGTARTPRGAVGRRQAGSDRSKGPLRPHPFFVARPGFGSPSPLSR
jgi:hypothetical protein